MLLCLRCQDVDLVRPLFDDYSNPSKLVSETAVLFPCNVIERLLDFLPMYVEQS